MRRILTTGTLGLLATLAVVAFSAGSAAAKAAPSGLFTVPAGQTIHFTDMNIDSSSSDQVFYDTWNSKANYYQRYDLGHNSGYEGTDHSLGDQSWTNTTGRPVSVGIGLRDMSYYLGDEGFPIYWSYGSSEFTGGNSFTHVALGYATGKQKTVLVSINDTGNDGAEITSDFIPTLGEGNFNVTVTIGAH